MRINTIFPGYPRAFGGLGCGCQAIVEGMQMAGAIASLSCETVDATIRRPFHRLVMPPWAMSLGYRVFSSGQLDMDVTLHKSQCHTDRAIQETGADAFRSILPISQTIPGSLQRATQRSLNRTSMMPLRLYVAAAAFVATY